MPNARGKGDIAFVMIKVALWLLIGAVVGVTASWVCYRNFVIALDRSAGGQAGAARLTAAIKGLPQPPMPALVPMNEAPAALIWPRRVPPNWPANPQHIVLWFGTGWRAYSAQGSIPEAGSFTLLAEEFGVPFRGLASWDSMAWPPHFRPERGDRMEEQRSLSIQSRLIAKYIDAGSLPLTPLWPGFALNTLFYAAIAWGLWQIPGAIRRRSRRRAGKCVRCGYDRAGIAPEAPCPECGGHTPGKGI